jgi:hypothetical protein
MRHEPKVNLARLSRHFQAQIGFTQGTHEFFEGLLGELIEGDAGHSNKMEGGG